MTMRNLPQGTLLICALLVLSSCGEKSSKKKSTPNPIGVQNQGVPTPQPGPIYTPGPTPSQNPTPFPNTKSNCIPGSGQPPCSLNTAYDTKGGGNGYPPTTYNPGQKEYIQNPGQNCPPGYYCNTGGGAGGGFISGGLSASFYSQQDVISCMGRALERGIPVTGGWPIFDGGIQAGIIGSSAGLGYTIDGASSTNFPFPHVVMLKVVNVLNAGTVYLNNPRAVYCIKQTSFLSAMSYSACNPLGVIIYQNSGWLGYNALSIPGCGGF
jgi:hypothetical protein